MAFNDNSGDILLDVVLTDLGRKKLARGDGSFQITKFALADDEVDYSLYNFNHNSGSAYYDLEIMQTPILEAFTSNFSSCKSKLSSYENLNLLYLPILKLNTNLTNTRMHTNTGYSATESFLIAVDRFTEGTAEECNTTAVGTNSDNQHVQGIIFGASFTSDQMIRIDQGLDTSEISPKQRSLMAGMMEDLYIVQMDNRLGRIVDQQGGSIGQDYVDDNHIAYYTVSAPFVSVNREDGIMATEAIEGPRGTILQFKIGASLELNTSTYLFTKLGGTFSMTNKDGNQQSVRYIDSMVRVVGMKTGYKIDVPIRYIKTIT